MSLSSKHIPQELIDKNVQQELITLHFAHAIKSNIFILIACPFIVFILKSVIPITYLLLWIALMWTLAGIRFFVCYLFKKKRPSARKQHILTNTYVAVTAMVGISWSVLALLPNALDNVYSHSLISFMMAGIIAIALPVLAMNLPALVLYITPFPLVFSCSLIISQHPLATRFTIVYLFFLLFMLLLGKQQHTALIKSLSNYFTNIELIKQLEVEMNRATVASRAKSDFLANMSHEIRTPMNGVLGITELLLQADDLPEKHWQQVKIIRDSGRTLLHVINDILDFSKIEAGKMELEHIHFDLRDLFAEVYGLFAKKCDAKALTLTCQVQENVPRIIQGDPGRLRQILINLIGNGIKFTRKGSVQCTADLVRQIDGASILCFEVSDTGIGLTPEQKKTIFDSFSQADNSTTRQYGGTGLGLTISRQLVELMGGSMSVESTHGLGACFRFTVEFQVPVDQKTVLTRYQQEQQKPDLLIRKYDCRVLLAEDNQTNLIVAREMLNMFGCKVDLALNGLQAVEAVKKNRYDLVFMDCQMPELDGYSATGEIRALEQRKRGEHTTIIALTAHAMSGDRERCLNAGMDDYLSKPINQNELQSILEKWTSGAK